MASKEYLKNINLFSHLDDEALDFLSSITTISNYTSESILYYESDIINKLLFLVKGLIRVYKVDKYNNDIFLYYIHENSMITELSSLDNDDISCFSNAEFVEDSVILSINFKLFKDKFLSNSPLTLNFIKELIFKNQQLHCIVNRELVFDATAKVAYMLINDLEMFNRLKRVDVSVLLHIQPETLSRVLRRFDRNSLINIEKGKIEIMDSEQLNKIFDGVGQ
jgi:CRP/FNR family transcriptional regulator